MTKPTLSQFFKYGPWVLPALLLPLPIWALVRLHPGKEPTYTVAQKPLPSPSPTFSAFPFLKANSGLSSAAVSPNPQPSAAKPTLPSPTVSKAELARRRQLVMTALTHNVDTSIEMHVAIASGASLLSVVVSGSAQLLDQNGKPLQTLSSAQPYSVQAAPEGMVFGGRMAPNVLWVVPEADSVVNLGDRSYRGKMLLVGDKNQLWAVNYVNLRQYLYSVVGAEVSPSWPIEALKAQAIAARSYALTYYFKPANSLYHMGSDEYFQVYKGIESEADTTRKAVDETAGSFVSYRGGIVESLYAASDDIVAEAFQGHGMSQIGALNLAEKGYTHVQILKNYYPKTAVGRIEIDSE
jgi:stage II sporulation protein D